MPTTRAIHIQPTGALRTPTAMPIDLWRSTWTQALDHLRRQQLTLLQRSAAGGVFVGDGDVHQVLVEDTAMYESCLANAQEHHTLPAAQPQDSQTEEQIRFYRLALALAQSYLELAENRHTNIELVSGTDEEQAWNSHRWLEELRRSARDAQQKLKKAS